ncbi:arylsulfatase B-like [Bacillus rossius redtenbacheri]|uniref:arylsulfatase B-like n=1 Tax=Bacillus rossius redtenbacheri TaxID=93214 RepID=UPI002FDE763D
MKCGFRWSLCGCVVVVLQTQRREMLRGCWLLLLALTGCEGNHRPHIVVIMADDLGWNDVGFHGSDQIPTPNLDALAYSGAVLNSHYTLPTCTPSRTAFLTGRHPIRSGRPSLGPATTASVAGAANSSPALRVPSNSLRPSSRTAPTAIPPASRGGRASPGQLQVNSPVVTEVPPPVMVRVSSSPELLGPSRVWHEGIPLRAGEPRGIPLSETLLPERLQDLGYVTRLVGKWHVGSHQTRYLPTQRGFASHLGYWYGYVGYRDHNIQQVTGTKMLSGLDMHRDLATAPELRGQYATDVLTREAVRIVATHNASRPLYLQVAHLAVHSGNDSLRLEVRDERDNDQRFGHIQDSARRRYAGMVAALDDSVGAVVGALADRGMLNDSVLVFLSDNGAQTHGLHANSGSNWPLRGLKFTVLEGGVRTVCAVWSARLHRPGMVSSQLVHITDWLPTLYAAAGGDVSSLGEIDGVDQWPVISGSDGAASPRDEVLLNIDTVEGTEGIICGRWKLVRGSYRGGVYDGHCGASGREGQAPGYDVEAVLQSRVATALASLRPGCDRDTVLRLRAEATVRCEVSPKTTPGPLCNTTCLYDLQGDPCEVNNVAADQPRVVAALSGRLDWFRTLAVGQLNQPVDLNSDPALHNGSWWPWLDE